MDGEIGPQPAHPGTAQVSTCSDSHILRTRQLQRRSCAYIQPTPQQQLMIGSRIHILDSCQNR